MMKTKLPRIPGFKYAPRVYETSNFDGAAYYVGQWGSWMHNSVKGPAKPTRAEAIKAWQRLVRNIKKGTSK